RPTLPSLGIKGEAAGICEVGGQGHGCERPLMVRSSRTRTDRGIQQALVCLVCRPLPLCTASFPPDPENQP
ncbi:hypothetical protein P7K49_005944, partial [Saguinus oedipus]